jgi:hypothetical protein
MTFLGDEGRDAIVIYNILHGKFTLLGPTASVGGFFMGPAYYYIVTPFFWLFNYSPVGASVMVALLGVATVWMVYKIGSEFFNQKAGLIAALLYALSPLVILYSRSSWNPNVIPFFTLATLYFLYKAVEKKRILLFFLSGFLFGIDIQLHYTELFLGPVIILYTIICYTRLFYKKSLWKLFSQILYAGSSIFGGFLVGFSPFLAFELRHEFLNTQSILHFIFSSGETGASTNFIMTIVNVVIRLFGRLLVDFPLPQDFVHYTSSVLTIGYWLVLFVTLVSLGYLIFMYIKFFHDIKKFTQLSLLLFWLAIGVLFFGLYKKPIYDYYFAFLFPIPFLLFGGVLADVYDNTLFSFTDKKKIYIGKAVVLVLLVIIVGIFITHSPLQEVPNNQLTKTKEISNFVLSKTDNKPFNFALITGGNSDHAYKYFFLRENREPIIIQNPMIDPKRETVTDQLLVICDSLPCSPLGDSLWEIAGFGRAEIVGHWKVSYVEVYKLVHYTGSKLDKLHLFVLLLICSSMHGRTRQR